jgi:hypothetical protein
VQRGGGRERGKLPGGDCERPVVNHARQFVKRRILTLRMRPNAASVAMSDDPP